LYKVEANEGLTKKAFVLANKSSKVTLEKDFADINLRETVILGQSEELPLAEAPILKAVFGNSIELENPMEGLKVGQQLIISDKSYIRWDIHSIGIRGYPGCFKHSPKPSR
jgi:hypothetical protein